MCGSGPVVSRSEANPQATEQVAMINRVLAETLFPIGNAQIQGIQGQIPGMMGVRPEEIAAANRATDLSQFSFPALSNMFANLQGNQVLETGTTPLREFESSAFGMPAAMRDIFAPRAEETSLPGTMEQVNQALLRGTASPMTKFLGGDLMNPSSAELSTLAQPVRDQFEQVVMPQIRREATRQGAPGGGVEGDLTLRAGNQYQRTIQEMFQNLVQQGRGQTLQGINQLVPMAQQLALQGPQAAAAGAGAQRQNQLQSLLLPLAMQAQAVQLGQTGAQTAASVFPTMAGALMAGPTAAAGVAGQDREAQLAAARYPLDRIQSLIATLMSGQQALPGTREEQGPSVGQQLLGMLIGAGKTGGNLAMLKAFGA